MPYKVFEYEYDVVVVGAGGAGLRATLGMAAKNIRTACITKLFPTRSHTVAAQGGISAALGNVKEDDWRWHMYDTVKGSHWLGDQDAIEFMCKNAKQAVIELEHMGVPFSRTEEGKIYQRPFGGMTTHYGKGDTAVRTCAAADRTGHAILHTLYQQCIKHNAEFFVEYFALDLIMNNQGECTGVVAWDLEHGNIHIFKSKIVMIATGGYGRAYLSTTTAYTCTGDGGAMCLRAGLSLQDMEFVQFHPTGLYGVGCLISEAARGEGGHLINSEGERFMERYAPKLKELASRDVVARAIMQEVLEGRGVGERKDHVYLMLSHLSDEIINTKLPSILETAKIFANVDATKDPIPVVPTSHYTMGGIPVNIHGQALRSENEVVPGLMAIGESACVSVHGANRLGSNSLLDLIVFGKAAAEKASEIIGESKSFTNIDRSTIDNILSNFDKLRQGSREISVATLRNRMQKIMHKHVSVFRTEESLKLAAKLMREVSNDLQYIKIMDQSLIWNTELVDALELKNLIQQSIVTIYSALNRTESRGAHARDDFPDTDNKNWLKHTIISLDNDNQTKISYRAVKLKPLTDEVKPVEIEDRVY